MDLVTRADVNPYARFASFREPRHMSTEPTMAGSATGVWMRKVICMAFSLLSKRG